MNAKTISVITIFAALTIALNLSPLKMPAPYAPFLIYQIWEVPIVAASLLYGFSVGVGISLINTIALLIVFPGALPTGPLYNLAAILGMLLGLYVIHNLLLKSDGKQIEAKGYVLLTALGGVTRVIMMTVVNWALLPHPPPIGFSMPSEVVTPILPLIVFFNATLALYTIPIGCILTKAIRTRTTPLSIMP